MLQSLDLERERERERNTETHTHTHSETETHRDRRRANERREKRNERQRERERERESEWEEKEKEKREREKQREREREKETETERDRDRERQRTCHCTTPCTYPWSCNSRSPGWAPWRSPGSGQTAASAHAHSVRAGSPWGCCPCPCSDGPTHSRWGSACRPSKSMSQGWSWNRTVKLEKGRFRYGTGAGIA